MSARTLLVVSSLKQLNLTGVEAEVLTAREYLKAPPPGDARGSVKVYNLCNSTRYQSIGYYVSLLAEARGHSPCPSVATLRDVRMLAVARAFSGELEELIQKSLQGLEESEFSLRVYFGKTPDPRFARVAAAFNRLFPAPLLGLQFQKRRTWQLAGIKALHLQNLEPEMLPFLEEALRSALKPARGRSPALRRSLYDLALLCDPEEPHPPSNPKALRRFTEAARKTGFDVEVLGTGDIGRLNEFDALFIRQTTAVDQPVYRVARMAFAEGLVVVDDPWSILRSANKIYLNESLQRAGLDTPGTRILTRDDLKSGLLETLHHPLVLKIPDGSFSRGVHRAETPAETRSMLKEMLTRSELILAQEFLTSSYDWRIGILDREPLYACKYYMARGHWQIYNWAAGHPGRLSGKSETLPLDQVPATVLDTAIRAAALMGDGLYGVDLKQIGDRVVVIEVNDNPNIDAGVEDAVDGKALYLRLAGYFRQRIEAARA